MSNRPRTRKPASKSAPRKLPIVPIVVAVAIVAGAIAAILITQLGGDDDGTPVQQTDNGRTELKQIGEVEVSGPPLSQFDSGGTDSAIGTLAPTVKGTSFDGTPVIIERGSPTLVLFAAHWCPHCQAEIPRLTGPFRNLPAGTKVVTVSTEATPKRPNYPPSQWFAEEKWPTPVLADDAKSTVAAAYGLSSFPFFVFLDRSGRVVERSVGEQAPEKVMARLQALAST